MTRRIMPDHGKYRWTLPLLAFILLLAALPAGAQRRPRLLGTPVPQPADTLRISSITSSGDGGQIVAPAVEEPAPVPLPGGAGSAAAFPVSRRLQMRSTAYCLRGTMRTGVRVRDGMAAGDPSVLPLGSVVRVSFPDGRLIGIFVIMDTGGAVRGNKIDLWFDSCREASDWGIQNVVAEVLEIGRA
jgi:3D (Asp-Asp-Asp) domain-containing protein